MKMTKKTKYLLSLTLLLMSVFLVAKVAFAVYNREVEAVSAGEMFRIWWHGALLDLRTAALMLVVPALLVTFVRKGVRALLIAYFCLLAVAAGIVLVGDMIMYEFWEFKISSVVLSYAASPEGTTNSVSVGFILARLLLLLSFILLIFVPAVWLTPKRFEEKKNFVAPVLIVAVALLPIRVGQCYHRGTLFRSHAATNPIFRFATSFLDARTYRCPLPYCDDVTAAYRTGDEVTDTLLRTDRPNVLLVMMESFGGKFVEELGGIPDVAPNLSRLIPEGIFWEQYYSNSFRTDRGTVSTLSGWISYPTVSPMKQRDMHGSLSSLARSFNRAGYRTGYMYGGPMTNMGKYQYIADMEFEALMDDTYFTSEELNCSWGAHDEVAGMKMFRTIEPIDTAAQWFMTWMTISSHEPWNVPYSRLEDERLNAFAYADHCVGELIDSLRTLPAWDNLLVIIIPDHGYLYEQTYDTGDFFHAPMLWLGGAIREPRRMSVLMNQSDIAATLLAQMGLPHDDYPWSRNVLSPDYKPFVYCNYPAGLFFKDETGETLYDLTARKGIPVGEAADSARLEKALSILRCSYSQLPNP